MSRREEIPVSIRGVNRQSIGAGGAQGKKLDRGFEEG